MSDPYRLQSQRRKIYTFFTSLWIMGLFFFSTILYQEYHPFPNWQENPFGSFGRSSLSRNNSNTGKGIFFSWIRRTHTPSSRHTHEAKNTTLVGFSSDNCMIPPFWAIFHASQIPLSSSIKSPRIGPCSSTQSWIKKWNQMNIQIKRFSIYHTDCRGQSFSIPRRFLIPCRQATQ